jgi:CheY-like chemotaxis protein
MFNECSLLWVDDSIEDNLNWIPLIQKYGCKIEAVPSAQEGIDKITKKRYNKILVDLNMPKMNGVEFIEKMETLSPDIPITIVSAHIDEPFWKRKIRKLSKEYDQIQSPFPIAENPKFTNVVWKILKDTNSPLTGLDLSLLSFESIQSLDQNNLEFIKNKIIREKEEELNILLKENNASWIVVCGNNLIMSDRDSDTFPDSEELNEIGKNYNCFPILYFKPPVIEEINWNNTRSNDYYPTIGIDIYENELYCPLTGDFDTGSDSTFLDFDMLKEKGIVNEGTFDLPQNAFHLGKVFRYIKKKKYVCLHCEDKEIKPKKTPILFVKDWSHSPFQISNQNRSALIGRDIIQIFECIIHLDTRNKTTKTYKGDR